MCLKLEIIPSLPKYSPSYSVAIENKCHLKIHPLPNESERRESCLFQNDHNKGV